MHWCSSTVHRGSQPRSTATISDFDMKRKGHRNAIYYVRYEVRLGKPSFLNTCSHGKLKTAESWLLAHARWHLPHLRAVRLSASNTSAEIPSREIVEELFPDLRVRDDPNEEPYAPLVNTTKAGNYSPGSRGGAGETWCEPTVVLTDRTSLASICVYSRHPKRSTINSVPFVTTVRLSRPSSNGAGRTGEAIVSVSSHVLLGTCLSFNG